MTYQEIIKEVASELNLPAQVVKEAYESYWKFIRESIKGLPLKEDLSKEEFKSLRTNFNIPSLGKLSCTYDRYINLRKRRKIIEKLRNGNYNKEGEANV